MCPVCTVAVASGLGISRWLGIDDTISGFWIGALILSVSFWFIRWLKGKYGKEGFNLPIILVTYLITLLPLTRLGGGKKLIIGTAIGSLVFLLGIWLDKKVRQIKGKQIISYQKIIFPVSLLILSSAVAYFLLK